MNQGEKHPLPETDIWVVRAGRGGIHAQRFVEKRIAAIDWDVGELSATTPDEEVKNRIKDQHPGVKPGSSLSGANQVIRFFKEIAIGDSVATYAADNRLYHIGIIQSEAKRSPIPAADGAEQAEYEYARDVEWLYQVPRDRLTAGTRNSLSGLMTLFRLSTEASKELRSHCLEYGAVETVANTRVMSLDEPDSGEILKDYSVKAEQFVEDQIAKLGWEQVQDLVAGILRAMGYKTRVSQPGPDRGVDVSASPDGLGLVEPRIFVEVKHRKGPTGVAEVRSFLGGRKAGDRCLYVSTGGFSQQAHYEAERASIPLTLINMPYLRELLLNHYENLDSGTRALVPLKRVYLPIAE